MIFSESLKKNHSFREVYKNGKFFSRKYLTMHVTKNDKGRNFLGITVSKKVGNAVQRNRIKRLVKEVYRLNEEKFFCGMNIVVVARVGSNEASYSLIERDLLKLARLHRILK